MLEAYAWLLAVVQFVLSSTSTLNPMLLKRGMQAVQEVRRTERRPLLCPQRRRSVGRFPQWFGCLHLLSGALPYALQKFG